ncbi:hypothetical protein DPEC_G00265960 [Dallia pectoralis]|uniref:Uncharacterized protein n=1 Tax=Dallia pectoralis TaxID=75939 RepID=A0ACC2FN78_DALPE|nr:hypothetical protein DPEC_G00265960 [Dallia pectoralis]
MSESANNGAESMQSHPLTLADLQASLQSLRSGLVAELSSVLETQLNSAIEAAVTPAVEAALAPLSSMLDGIRSTAEEQGRRMDAFEHDMCNYSDRIVALEETVARLGSENQQLKDKTEDLESRSRRCNLRIVGIPEKMERGDPVGFMTGFFTEVLGTTLVPAPLKLDRAYRIGAPPRRMALTRSLGFSSFGFTTSRTRNEFSDGRAGISLFFEELNFLYSLTSPLASPRREPCSWASNVGCLKKIKVFSPLPGSAVSGACWGEADI